MIFLNKGTKVCASTAVPPTQCHDTCASCSLAQCMASISACRQCGMRLRGSMHILIAEYGSICARLLLIRTWYAHHFRETCLEGNEGFLCGLHARELGRRKAARMRTSVWNSAARQCERMLNGPMTSNFTMASCVTLAESSSVMAPEPTEGPRQWGLVRSLYDTWGYSSVLLGQHKRTVVSCLTSWLSS
jgi:hypothetical protein